MSPNNWGYENINVEPYQFPQCGNSCPPRPCCRTGPTGPTGPAGRISTILGSYDTLDQLRRAHPTGTSGDAYLVDGVLYMWDAGTQSWVPVGKLQGPTGPTGSTGPTGPVGTVLGSYDSLEELKAAHPTGAQGDAYLVGGVLYVWDEETRSWSPVGDLTGPTGPAGPISTILGSVESVADLPEVGNRGDAYLVNGVLYMWDEETSSWQAVGDLVGPTGPVGTILGSYETLADLTEEHPTGNQGDAYLVDGTLYVWDTESSTWQPVGNLAGPTGPTGPTGPVGTILGSYETLAELTEDHPTGNQGDAYLVDGTLYVWDTESISWQPVGNLAGPTGPTGPTGPVGTILGSYETLADLNTEHPTGNQGDAYLVDGVLYVWDTESISWQPVGNLRGPAAESRSIIPFASTIAPLTHAVSGIPTRVSLLGFGYGDTKANLTELDDYSMPIDSSDGHFDLDENDSTDNFQLAFSLPFDMIIRSVVITCGNWGQYDFPYTVYPYVQLYAAEPTSNSFRIIDGAIAIPETGLGPGTVQRGTMRFGITRDLDIRLNAGTRIAIGGLMRTDATGTTDTEPYWLYFTGAIGLAYAPEEAN